MSKSASTAVYPRVSTAESPVFMRGVTYPLPVGESLLWEARPDGSAVAKHVFMRWPVLAYFAIVFGWWLFGAMRTAPADTFLNMLVVRVALIGVVLLVVEGLARAVARTSTYAITDRRIVLHIGLVVPMTINIPLRVIESAGVGTFRDGTGQIVLTLAPSTRIAYFALWPHCRPFTFKVPQPVLRGLVEPARVATLLQDAVKHDMAAAEREAIEADAAARDAEARAGVPDLVYRPAVSKQQFSTVSA